MHLFSEIALVMMAAAGLYSYYYLRRTIAFWRGGSAGRGGKIAAAAGAVLLAAGSRNPFGAAALVIYHVLGTALAMELINGILCLVKRKTHKTYLHWNRVFGCGLLPVLLTAVILIGGYVNMLNVREKIYYVSTEKQLEDPEGYKVIFLSDLHFGTTMDAAKLQTYCREMEAQEPDLVILGGDIVDERTTGEEMESALRILGSIKSTYGVFYVYGNHDSAGYSGTPHYTLQELNRCLQDSGIVCISDEVYAVNDDLLLVGRGNRGSRGTVSRADTEQLLQGQDLQKFILLADHQPVNLKENAASGVDLQLSGHTHGGQIWPIGLISDILGFGELNYGSEKIGSYEAIVSSGMAGWGYPIRTGHNSEYLMIYIKNE